MKIYINNEDWADEGDVFFCSIRSEERLKKLRDLIDLYVELDLFPESIQIYWGTNESFDFTPEELKQFIDDAVDISEEELGVLSKFDICGFDIYYHIEEELREGVLFEYGFRTYGLANENISRETLDRIKDPYIDLFSEEFWEYVEKAFEKTNNQ